MARYVPPSEEAPLREVAQFPAGEQNEFGDRWSSVYVDGKVGPDGVDGAGIRLCSHEDGSFCMFGRNARKSGMDSEDPNLDEGSDIGGMWGGPPPPWTRVDTRAPLGSASNPRPFRYADLPAYVNETMPVSLDMLHRQVKVHGMGKYHDADRQGGGEWHGPAVGA